MWQAFINWLKSLFESKDSDSDSIPFDNSSEKNGDFPFTGAIKDTPDSRDQIFEESK